MSERVNHPSHYLKPGRKECIEEMLDTYGRRITAVFCLTNAYKYLYRAGEKENNSKEQDIEKAKWYFKFVIKRVYSSITGKNLIKLYRDIAEEIKKYD